MKLRGVSVNLSRAMLPEEKRVILFDPTSSMGMVLSNGNWLLRRAAIDCGRAPFADVLASAIKMAGAAGMQGRWRYGHGDLAEGDPMPWIEVFPASGCYRLIDSRFTMDGDRAMLRSGERFFAWNREEDSFEVLVDDGSREIDWSPRFAFVDAAYWLALSKVEMRLAVSDERGETFENGTIATSPLLIISPEASGHDDVLGVLMPCKP